MKPQANNFADYVRQARRRARITQGELAKAIGRSKAWVVDLERSRTLPADRPSVDLLAEALGLDLLDVWSRLLEQRSGKILGDPMLDEDWGLIGDRLLANTSPLPEEDEIGYAPPKSHAQIEEAAETLSTRLFGDIVARGGAIPVLEAIENAERTARETGLGTCLVSDTWETGPEGKTCVREGSGCIEVGLRNDVWRRAERGHGRSRFTAAHELGHAVLHGALLLQKKGHVFRDAVCTASERLQPGIKIYESPEWQANSWASAFLMPCTAVQAFVQGRSVVGQDCTIENLADNFQMSLQAARIRLEKLLPRLIR